MHRQVALLALVFATGALAQPTYGPCSVMWDPKGAFVFSGMGEAQRYDVRSAQWAGQPDEDVQGEVLKASRESPDHSAVAGVLLNPTIGASAWKNGVFTAAGKGDHKLFVKRGGKTFDVASLDAIAAAQTYWSPDGHYVVFVTRSTLWLGGDGSHAVSVYVGASGPRAQVLGAKDVLPGAKDAALRAVEGAGGFVVFAGAAKKARDKSVVYAAAGNEELAQSIAKALPGGATVEALSWQAGVELVVALGKSALVKGGK